MNERTGQRGDQEVGVCHVCGERFDTQEALSKHLMDEHPGDVLPDPKASENDTITDEISDAFTSGRDDPGEDVR